MFRRLAVVGVGLAAVVLAACSSPPPPVATVPALPPPPSTETRTGWVLRLENERVLRDTSLPPAAPGSDVPAEPRSPRIALSPDLVELSLDADAGIRRRAALAIGRVKNPTGFGALASALGDTVPDVRAAAAFGLGLLADTRAVTPLVRALDDADVLVRARAIEALGLVGDKSAVPALYRAAAECPARLAPVEPDADPPAPIDDVSMCQLALFALVRLQSYDAIAALTLDPQGQPRSRWWPVAYALQRINDPRAAPALRALAQVPGVYTAGFALRGLATYKDTAALPLARTAARRREADVKVRIAAVRLVGQLGDDSDARLLLGLLGEGEAASPLGLEVIGALGALARPSTFETLVDLFADPAPAVRSAAMAAAAKVDVERFLVILSGLGRDRDWSVRAALATVLSTLPPARVTPALLDLSADDDARVVGTALEALAAVKAPELTARLIGALDAADFVVRATAARLLGASKAAGGVARLRAAYERGQSDSAYGARAAALDALAAYGGDEAIAALEAALADREWPVRAKAAALLKGLGRPTAAPATPAPTRQPAAFFESAAVLRPAYSPHVLADTRYGTIELELDVINAPLTSATFIELARGGFFAGMKVHRLVPTFVIQAGDPRGDGEGGPGFTIRDELSPTPYLRGTLGMALDWADTAGSQWFITLSPQPHLDGRYTVFGRVVNGWDVLDRVTQWDVIERVRIWDGVELR